MNHQWADGRGKRRSRLRGALRLGFLALFAFAGGACAVTLGSSPKLLSAADSPFGAVADWGRVLVAIETRYVEPVERDRLLTGAVKGMVSELDPHSAYLTPDEMTALQSDTKGQFGGVGIEVESRGEALIVLGTIEGGPAERAGLRSGDAIVKIDGELVSAAPLDKIVLRMRGAPGTRVRLTLRRQGVRELLTMELVREVIRVHSVASLRLDGGVGYVRIKQFQERTHRELLEAAAQFRREGPLAGLIVDLRNDPGGLVDEAAACADEFLDSGAIYSLRHRGAVIEEVQARGGGAFVRTTTTILVNEWTASASELLAGALQDHRRARVVGEKTFGKGSVQTVYELPGGAGLKLTTARYYTPLGRAIQAQGIHPDVVVEAGKASRGETLRESDLLGHLSAEEADSGAPPAMVVDAGDDSDDGRREPVRSMPKDPRKGRDGALRVAYELLLSDR